LFIGEDSGNHLNNFLWALNRGFRPAYAGCVSFPAPAGGEHTGLQVVPALNGHAYIMGNVQHPGAATDLKQLSRCDIRVEGAAQARSTSAAASAISGGLPAIEPSRR
jgi:hypothetical protein